MVKMKMNKKYNYKDDIKWNCCPMGTMHDGIIECYYYGIVKIKECNKCSYRKNDKIVTIK